LSILSLGLASPFHIIRRAKDRRQRPVSLPNALLASELAAILVFHFYGTTLFPFLARKSAVPWLGLYLRAFVLVSGLYIAVVLFHMWSPINGTIGDHSGVIFLYSAMFLLGLSAPASPLPLLYNLFWAWTTVTLGSLMFNAMRIIKTPNYLIPLAVMIVMALFTAIQTANDYLFAKEMLFYQSPIVIMFWGIVVWTPDN
jgi:hypothetical protein